MTTNENDILRIQDIYNMLLELDHNYKIAEGYNEKYVSDNNVHNYQYDNLSEYDTSTIAGKVNFNLF